MNMNIDNVNAKRKEMEGDKNSSLFDHSQEGDLNKPIDKNNIVGVYGKSETNSIEGGKNESYDGFLEYRNQNTNEIINHKKNMDSLNILENNDNQANFTKEEENLNV